MNKNCDLLRAEDRVGQLLFENIYINQKVTCAFLDWSNDQLGCRTFIFSIAALQVLFKINYVAGKTELCLDSQLDEKTAQTNFHAR